MTTTLQILLHAPDAEGLQRARMNAVNARKGDPPCTVRIIANAAAVAAALVAFVDHEAVNPVLVVVLVQRVHDEPDGPVLRIERERDAFRLHERLRKRIHIARDKAPLLFPNGKVEDGEVVVPVDGDEPHHVPALLSRAVPRRVRRKGPAVIAAGGWRL